MDHVLFAYIINPLVLYIFGYGIVIVTLMLSFLLLYCTILRNRYALPPESIDQDCNNDKTKLI